MKIKKSHLKELIRHAIVEDIMDKEIENPKTGNKIKVRTALQLPDEHPANKKAKGMVAKSSIDKDDVGGPAYPNVKKGVKTSKQAKGSVFKKKDKSKDDDSMKAAKSSNKKMEIDVLNKDADKGDGAQIDTENGTVTWTSGDPDEDTFFATNEDGEEIEVDYNDIVRFHNDNDSIMKNLKTEKVSYTLKPMKDFSAGALKDLGKRVKALDGKRGHKGAYRRFNMWLDLMKANQKAGDKDGVELAKSALSRFNMIYESKTRRFTVKEVRMWMKKLEENRYKKVYNSDARRVSWMCNHIGENLENMPKSMRKKWTKAQYGRERYLAKEFLKSQLASLKEQKLRKVIRKIIKEAIHHMDMRMLYVPKKDFKNAVKLLRLNIKHGNVEVEKKPSSKVKGHYRLTTTKKMFDDVVTHLAMKNIGVKTIAKGKM